MHECPYCGAELEEDCHYGTNLGRYEERIIGHIFYCPNANGFNSEEEARAYEPEYIKSIDDLEENEIDWQDICCQSNIHHVSGSFYTDYYGELKEGYPC